MIFCSCWSGCGGGRQVWGRKERSREALVRLQHRISLTMWKGMLWPKKAVEGNISDLLVLLWG